MAFCTSCGKQIESGVLCDECKGIGKAIAQSESQVPNHTMEVQSAAGLPQPEAQQSQVQQVGAQRPESDSNRSKPLAVAFIVSLVLRKLSIATGIPAIVFGVVLFLNSMAGLTLAIGETNVGGSLKFYIYSAAIFIQMVVIAIFANWLMSGLNRF